MFGINNSCTRLWEAKGALGKEFSAITASTLSCTPFRASCKHQAQLAHLHKKDIVLLALFTFMVAIGIAALSFYGLNAVPDTVEYLAPIMLLPLVGVLACALAVIVTPRFAWHLLENVEQEHLEFQALPFNKA